MKATLYDINGKKKSEIEMPKIFDSQIREDIVAKYFEIDKFIQPYTPNIEAGKKYSASGKIGHRRHKWKSHYGRGISRIPRKTMWRRGTQFMWIGATISSTRGGRRAHPPKGIGKEKKVNKKEIEIAMNSGFASTANKKYIIERYSSLDKLDIKVPIVVESKLDNTKTKEVLNMLKVIFGDLYSLALKNKKIRPGKGKIRNRKHKSNAGVLLIKGKDEKIKIKGIDIKNVDEVRISDLYPLGRLSIYTNNAIQELGGKK